MREAFRSGGDALAAGSWQEARALFEAALGMQESAEALEGLAMAAWWLDDDVAVLDARERAYGLYRRQREPRGAGRMALHLGIDHWTLRDAHAVAEGWLRRAEPLLAGLDPCAEHGWLALWQGQVALLLRHDLATARHHSARAADIARQLGLREVEMLAQAQEDLALVSEGDVAGAARDPASGPQAVPDQHRDVDLMVTTTSQLMDAWELLADFDAIARWGTVLDGLPEAWSSAPMVWRCRMAVTGALMWRGAWEEAEAILEVAAKAQAATRSRIGVEALARLARLRRRQGRYEESSALLEDAESGPLLVRTETEILLGWAELTLDDGDAAAARALVERTLGELRGAHPIRRLAGLALLVHAEVAFGKRDLAHAALADLQRTACTVTTDGVRASTRFAEGMVASSAGAFAAARDRLEEAVVLFQRAGATFETAQARIELAVALSGLGQRDAAERQAATAMDALCTLGAVQEAERAGARLPRLPTGRKTEAKGRPRSGLTSRELEVLRLVAEGRSNHAIAAELIVSVRTVERHMSNVYDKVGASGKAARVAAVAHARRHGLLAEPHIRSPTSREHDG